MTEQYGAQNRERVRQALGLVPPAPKPPVTPFSGPGNDLVLTPPPDAQAARRCRQLEHAEQCAYFAQINARLDPQEMAQGRFVALPDCPGADMIYAIPNANAAGKAIGVKLKLTGVRRGYPDINVERGARGLSWPADRVEAARRCPQRCRRASGALA